MSSKKNGQNGRAAAPIRPQQRTMPVRRMDGDDLYEWAQLMNEAARINGQIAAVSQRAGMKLGMRPGEVFDPHGYVVPGQALGTGQTEGVEGRQTPSKRPLTGSGAARVASGGFSQGSFESDDEAT